MTTFGHIVEALKSMSPLEILEVCDLDEDSDSLTNGLLDYIEDNMETIEERLIENGMIGELDEEI